jgi:hypothetical protein
LGRHTKFEISLVMGICEDHLVHIPVTTTRYT